MEFITTHLTVNGKSAEMALEAGTFVTLERKWADGDCIVLSLPMTVERREAYGGGIYFERGPLVYSYAIPAKWEKDTTRYGNMNGKYPADDNAFPCWSITPDGPWNFAVEEDAQASFSNGELLLPVRPVDWSLDEGPNGEKLTPDLPEKPVPVGPQQVIHLIPYGKTTLRLTVFPVIERTLIPAGGIQ